MSLREELHERIDQLDEAALLEVLKQLEALEKMSTAETFDEALSRVHERNQDLSGDEALRIATKAVEAHRRERRR